MSIHDAKIIETQINDNFKKFNNKGYIKEDDYRKFFYYLQQVIINKRS